MPTGNQLRAARSLVGMQQKDLAKASHLDVTTILRMEKCGNSPVRSQGHNIQAVLDALERKGVKIEDDGSIRPVGKSKR
jgi:predicted transcriptional regulator